MIWLIFAIQVAIKRLTNFSHHEYHSLQLLREVKLMKELQKRPGGDQFVPIVYDVVGAMTNFSDGDQNQTKHTSAAKQ